MLFRLGLTRVRLIKGEKMKIKNKTARHIMAVLAYCEWKFGHIANKVF